MPLHFHNTGLHPGLVILPVHTSQHRSRVMGAHVPRRRFWPIQSSVQQHAPRVAAQP
jgi:hypothetical protein